jgi:hypothetical protein
MPRRVRHHARLIAASCFLVVCAACRSQPRDTTARTSIEVTPLQTAVELGAPIDVEYRLSRVPDAPPLAGTWWVFVHVADEHGNLLWTDDHPPPSPPSSWGAAPVTYRRTMFAPRVAYTGRASIRAGLFSRDGAHGVRNGTVEQSFELRPASNAVFISYGDGWHGAERDAGEAAREWRWSTGDARLSFRNPRRDATLWLELDQPVNAVGPQTVELRAASELIASIRVAAGARRIERVPLPGPRLGSAPMVDIDLHVQPTFVPATIAGAASQDTRQLGVRVFNVHVGFH